MESKAMVWKTIKDFKLNSVLFRNCMWISLLIVLPLLVIVVIGYSNYTEEIQRQMSINNANVLEKCGTLGDNLFEEAISLADVFADFQETKFFVEKGAAVDEEGSHSSALMTQIYQYCQSYRYVKQIYIYAQKDRRILSRYGIEPVERNNDKWRRLYEVLEWDQNYVFTSDEDGVMLICKALYNDAGGRTGMVVLNIDMSVLGRMLEEGRNIVNRTLLMVDYCGRVIYGQNPTGDVIDNRTTSRIVGMESEETTFVSRNEKVLSVYESGTKAYRYVLMTNRSFFTEEEGRLQNYLTLTIIMLVICSLVSTILLTILTYRPVKKINNVIQSPYERVQSEGVSSKQDELLYITSYILNDMESRNKMSEELQQRVRSLNEAQARALQFQMNPHFLANILEVIKWSSVEEFGLGNNTSRMLTKLAALYRESLQDDIVLVTLKEEIEYLKRYMEILNFRYADRIQYVLDIEENALKYHVVKMTIQPLLENAIKHGLKPKQYYGTVTISAGIADNCMKIRVKNDGESLSRGKMEEINSDLRDKISTGGKVGLRNVNTRIKLIYGKNYGVQLQPNEGGEGVVTELTMPLI